MVDLNRAGHFGNRSTIRQIEKDDYPQAKARDDSGPAFGPTGDPGMSLRVYAAIHLRVPDSGISWLDQMIDIARLGWKRGSRHDDP